MTNVFLSFSLSLFSSFYPLLNFILTLSRNSFLSFFCFVFFFFFVLISLSNLLGASANNYTVTITIFAVNKR